MKRCVALSCLLSVLLLVCGCQAQPSPTPAPSGPVSGLSDFEQQLLAQAAAIPLEDFTLSDLEGTPHATNGYRGRILLLNLAATWCGYCKEEYPILQSASEQYEGRVAVVGIDTYEQQSGDTVKATLRQQLADAGVTYPVLLDEDNVIGKTFSPRGSVPMSVLVDADGIVRFLIPGAFPNEEKLFEILDFMLEHPDLLPKPE